MPYNVNFSRTSVRRAFSFVGLVGLAALAVSGCYEDKSKAYMSTLDKNGEIVAPPDAKLPPSAATPKTTSAATQTPDDRKALNNRIPTESEIGLPYYPGAVPHQMDKSAPAVATFSDAVKLVILESPDALAKVDDYYRSHLTGAQRLEEAEKGVKVIGYMVNKDAETRNSVEITRSGSITLITLASAKMSKPASQKPDKSKDMPTEYLPPPSTPPTTPDGK